MKKIILSAVLAAVAGIAGAQQVTFMTPATARIVKSADGKPYSNPENLSLVINAQPQNVKVKSTRQGHIVTYKTSQLTVTVNEQTRAVTFADSKGNVLMQEGGFQFSPISSGPDKGKYQVSQSFALDSNEPIYGLGLLQNGKMNLRGENRLMIQTNLEDYTHFFQSIKGYGIYWDNYSPTQITDGKELTLQSQVGDKVDYYFMYGQDADGVIREMRTISGQVPMLPLWTFGFHQSRERYKTSRELLEVVDRYRQDGVPFDGIVQDWQYWGSNYLWNAMDFLNDDFLDYKRMIDRVHEQNAHISISIWASFGPQTLQFRELKDKNLLYSFLTWPMSGAGGWPPNMNYPSGVRCYVPFSKTARDIYWNHLARLHNAGIDAWWMDSTDPDHIDFKDSDLDEVRPVTNPATGKDQMQSYRSVRNAFGLCSVEGVYQNQRAIDSTKRVFIYTRSCFAGLQRTGANTWSGDVASSWDSFRKQVPICLNFTLTANPNVNTDLGGFFANAYNKGYVDNTACHNPLYQELYVRWMQFGTFSPMMRSHGTEVARELYMFGQKGEPVYDALLNAVKLRYQLLPYIYSTSWQVTSNNDSYMRALVMDFADDNNTWDNGREFMFGRSLLVAPVLEALYTPEHPNQTDEMSGWDRSNQKLYIDGFKADWNAHKTYKVYLPKGADWYDFHTSKLFKGGQTIDADASIQHCPVFVKAGSIVPLCAKSVQYASVSDWQELDILVYPGRDAKFTLYEDEGDNYNYEKGMYSTIDFLWNNKTSTLTIMPRKGQFSGMHQERKFNIGIIGGSSYTCTYSGKKLTVKLPREY